MAETMQTSSWPSTIEACGSTFIPPPYAKLFPMTTSIASTSRDAPSSSTWNIAGTKRESVFTVASA